MLNTPMPFEVPTIQSGKFNYPSVYDRISAPKRTSVDSVDETRSRRSSGYAGEDEHSHILADPIADAPPVIVFFSFMNSQSKKWAVDHQVVQNMRRSVPQGTTIARYHAPMRATWDFGEELTHAWAVAKSLNVDDKVIVPLFEAIHSKRVFDLEGIRSIFDECGIPPQTFLREWGEKNVLIETQKMDSAVAHVDLQDVPGILVRGKYMVKLDTYDQDFSADGAIELVRKLLARE